MTVQPTPQNHIDDDTMAALIRIQRKLERLARAQAAYDRMDGAAPVGVFKTGERTYMLVDVDLLDEIGKALQDEDEDEPAPETWPIGQRSI